MHNDNIDAYVDGKLVLDQLVRARKEKGMTQVDMSEKTGLSQSTISAFESGKDRSPSFSTVMSYASALGKEIYIR